MDFGYYNDASMALAVELVNSEPLLGDPDDLADAEQLHAFVARHLPEWRGPVTDADIPAVHEVRADLRAAFLAQTPAAAAQRLNPVLRATGTRPELVDHDGRWHVHVVADEGGVAAALGSVAAMAMAAVIAEHGIERLGVCASQTCIDAFVDTTKNRSRRYCSDTCANVSGVRNHRARTAARGD